MISKRLIPKEFDISIYQKVLSNLKENMAELKFEQQSEVLVPYILENYEGFDKIEEMDILFQGGKAPLEPVFDWLKNRSGRKFEDARP